MKIKKQNKWNRLAGLFLIVAMCFGITEPYLAAPEDETIYIRTANDLIELSENCSYDKWSVGKKVVLVNDISLKDVEFEPIPYFAGTFDGQGHSILDLQIDGSFYPAGLFGTTKATSIVKNLNVSGLVMPDGKKNDVGGVVGINGGVLENVSFSGVVSGNTAVGGIAGTNKETGCIKNAFVQGNIFGEHQTGGIVGKNLGKVDACENESYVNNTSEDKSIRLDELNSNVIQNLYTLNSSDVMNAFTDTGGIAGYSSGSILESKNKGTVGYLHMGYNAGGIAGRNSGYISACVNEGGIYGRKDIGGITGQAEPYLETNVEASDIARVDRQLSGINKTIDSMTGNLDGASDEVKQSMDQISAYIEQAGEDIDNWSDTLNGISTELENLSNAGASRNDSFTSDFETLNDQVYALSDTIVGIVDSAKNFSTEDVISDTSLVNISSTTYGKIHECINKGEINGDINVGGIAGMMSIEYETDPEDDLSLQLSWEERKEYEAKSILYRCTNKGEVIAKKDNAGGICGQLDIGAISDCIAYGKISSENGDYVGGIAGLNKTTIQNCIANCRLSGKNYVGGIAGSGSSSDSSESTIQNCYSMVKILDFKQFSGAIAGCDYGNFENNYFVSGELQGINRITYENNAQLITYEELIELPDIPDELKTFTLTFVAEDKVIKSVDFDYGDSFGEDVVPEVPQKDGYSGAWDTTDLSNLCFDTIVTAEYTPYVTALKSEENRDSGRPILIVEGDFSENDRLYLTQGDLEQTKAQLERKGKVLENWIVKFSEDGQKRHMIRLLLEEDNAKIYVKEDGEWSRVSLTEIGSYQTFQTVGTQIEIAVVSKTLDLAVTIGVIVVLVLLLAAVVWMEHKKHMLSRWGKRIIARFGQKKMTTIGLVVGLVILALGGIYVALLPKIRLSAELINITKDILTMENQSMKLDLTLEAGRNNIKMDSNIYILDEGDTTVYCLEENGHQIYIQGDVVYLENGKPFYLGDYKREDRTFFEQVTELFKSAQITREERQDTVVYSITTEGEDAKNLLAVLVPSTEGQLATAGETKISLNAKDGVLKRVEISGSAVLNDANETNVRVSAYIHGFSELQKDEIVIPEEVKNAMEKKDGASVAVMGEDMYRLLLAWVKFDGAKQDGKVKVDVGCGPINIQQDCNWKDLYQGVAEISNAQNMANLPDLLYEVCLNGEFSCEKLGDDYVFQIKLEDDVMKHLAATIAPDIRTQSVQLSDGMVEITLSDNEITEMKVEIGGSIHVLLSDVDASVQAEFVFE